MSCVLSRFNRAQLFATLWNIALQVPLSMGFFRQEYWSGLPSHPPGDCPNQGLKLSMLHYRQILYCLSDQGSPHMAKVHIKGMISVSADRDQDLVYSTSSAG